MSRKHLEVLTISTQSGFLQFLVAKDTMALAHGHTNFSFLLVQVSFMEDHQGRAIYIAPSKSVCYLLPACWVKVNLPIFLIGF